MQIVRDFLSDNIGWIFLGIIVVYFGGIFWGHFFYKGKVREIIIVKKRKTTRNLLRSPMSFSVGPTYCELDTYTVDFRYKGKKMLHTCICGEDMLKRFSVGNTYIVRIRFGNIEKIYRK